MFLWHAWRRPGGQFRNIMAFWLADEGINHRVLHFLSVPLKSWGGVIEGALAATASVKTFYFLQQVAWAKGYQANVDYDYPGRA